MAHKMTTAGARLTGGALRELRVHLCQTSSASNGVREFITSNYASIKAANPQLPVLVRECSGITPRVWARYDYGREQQVSLENKTSAEVGDIILELSKQTPA